MSMQDRETLNAYSDKYWEMFNEIDGSYDDVAISTFKAGLLAKHDLRKSLTGKPVASVLMHSKKGCYARLSRSTIIITWRFANWGYAYGGYKKDL